MKCRASVDTSTIPIWDLPNQDREGPLDVVVRLMGTLPSKMNQLLVMYWLLWRLTWNYIMFECSMKGNNDQLKIVEKNAGSCIVVMLPTCGR